ncbi:cuticle protein 14 isoform b [Caerostris darwini]|uniref:Cuticle protein 14 isoform b n=1 Tax=Caerostris darwini TaxID=1538125 RepID=A0AAV4U1C0_9ARAC|nr:cuticle protein 14 isoform b [Caerostris darwini]
MIPVVKAFILTSLVALSQAYAIYNYPYHVNTGTSQQYNTQDGIGNYQFGYNEDHSSGGTFRKETGDAWGNKYGSYGLRDADGRYRVVNYVADQAGFRAAVKTNEPGVAPEDPASATINKPEPFISAPIKTVSKPLFYAPDIHHAASPEFPLLYQTYAPSSYYKGTPYTKRTYFSTKGSPYNKYGYYVYP